MNRILLTVLSAFLLILNMINLCYAQIEHSNRQSLTEWVTYYKQNKEAFKLTELHPDVSRRELAVWIMKNIGDLVKDYDDYEYPLITRFNKSPYVDYDKRDIYSKEGYQGKKLQEWKDYYKGLNKDSYHFRSDSLNFEDVKDDQKLTNYIVKKNIVTNPDFNKGYSLEQWKQYYKSNPIFVSEINRYEGSEEKKLTRLILKYHLIDEKNDVLTLEEWAHYYYYNLEAAKSPWLSEILTINEFIEYIFANRNVSGYYIQNSHDGTIKKEINTLEEWKVFYFSIVQLHALYPLPSRYSDVNIKNEFVLKNSKLNPLLDKLKLKQWLYYYTNNIYKPIELAGLSNDVSEYDLSIYILKNHNVTDNNLDRFVKWENLKNDDGTKARTLKEWETYFSSHPTAFKNTGLPSKTTTIHELDLYILKNKEVTDYDKYKYIITNEYGSKYFTEPDFKLTKTIVPYRSYNLDLEYTRINIISYDKRNITIKKIYINTQDHQYCLGYRGKEMKYTTQLSCRADVGDVISVDIITDVGRYEYTFR